MKASNQWLSMAMAAIALPLLISCAKMPETVTVQPMQDTASRLDRIEVILTKLSTNNFHISDELYKAETVDSCYQDCRDKYPNAKWEKTHECLKIDTPECDEINAVSKVQNRCHQECQKLPRSSMFPGC